MTCTHILYRPYYCTVILLLTLAVNINHVAPTTAEPEESDAAEPLIEGEPNCQPVNTQLCNINKYLTVLPFSNSLGHTDLNAALAELHKYAYLFHQARCRDKIQLFLCSLYAPVCVNTTIPDRPDRLLLPCRDDCEQARQVCNLEPSNATWPQEWNCEKFKYHRIDSLCVIDNGRTETPKNETVCAEDLFDCRLHEPNRDRKALCIENRWVCDNKNDCENGSDEFECEKRCTESQTYCDGRCLSKSDICNGKIDCGSGIDEQDCDTPSTITYTILFFIALLSSILLCVYLPKVNHSGDTLKDDESVVEPPKEAMNTHEAINGLHSHEQQSTYSNNYERITTGGYSATSSIYGERAYAINHPSHLSINQSIDINQSINVSYNEPPAAPPPTPASTPAPQYFYQQDY